MYLIVSSEPYLSFQLLLCIVIYRTKLHLLSTSLHWPKCTNLLLCGLRISLQAHFRLWNSYSVYKSFFNCSPSDIYFLYTRTSTYVQVHVLFYSTLFLFTRWPPFDAQVVIMKSFRAHIL